METLTPKEVANEIGVSADTVREMAGRGEIPMTQVGRKWVITRKKFSKWLEGRKRRDKNERTEGI